MSHLSFSFAFTISAGLLSIALKDHLLPPNRTFRASRGLHFDLVVLVMPLAYQHLLLP